jgi:ligand-binding SRPBCC domain-containing protein
MGRMYNLPLARTAVTAAVDLVEILTASSHICVIHGIELTQSTEVKDAEEEMLQLAWKSGQTTGGSGGGTSITPIPILIGDAAHGMTVEAFNTTKASAGTIVTHKVWDWNVRVPFLYVFTPETRLVIPPSTRATLELVSAPADSVTIGGQIVLEIIG